MKTIANHLIAVSVGLAVFSGVTPAANASIVSFNNKAEYEAALDPGYYVEPFMHAKYPNYSGQGFSYIASTEGDKWDINGDLSTESQGSIQFNFGPKINVFGGYFYNTDLDTSLNSLPLIFNLNSGGYVTTGTSATATTFYGFISPYADFSSATITSTRFPAAGTVIVGRVRAVPGPLPLLGAGAAFGLSRRLRRRRAVGHSER